MADSIVIDCTYSDAHPYYSELLNNNIGVVTPKKSHLPLELFNTLTKYHNYRYETTVGAGLPLFKLKTL